MAPPDLGAYARQLTRLFNPGTVCRVGGRHKPDVIHSEFFVRDNEIRVYLTGESHSFPAKMVLVEGKSVMDALRHWQP